VDFKDAPTSLSIAAIRFGKVLCFPFCIQYLRPKIKLLILKKTNACLTDVILFILIEFDGYSNVLMFIESLQEYILICCQLVNGGVIDKPGK
jgi:hypothetical protein